MALSKGIIFYLDHSPTILLEWKTAIRSYLENVTDRVPVTVFLGDKLIDLKKPILSELNTVNIQIVESIQERMVKRVINIWNNKPKIIQQSPYDTTLYLDCDVIFHGGVNLNSIFNEIQQKQFCCGFPQSKNYRSISIKNVSQAFGCKTHSKQKSNGFCVGYDKQASHVLEQWLTNIEILKNDNPNRPKEVRHFNEEVGLSCLNLFAKDRYRFSKSYLVWPHQTVTRDTIATHYGSLVRRKFPEFYENVLRKYAD